MKTIGIIPARYQSTRFPGKPLTLLLGKPMVIWVCEIVEKALGFENTFVATDDERIKKLVDEFGYQVLMTSSQCMTGTDRLWEVAQKVPADIYINIQCDEPTLDPSHIIEIRREKEENQDYVVNGMTRILEEDPYSPNLPKVLVNRKKELIYMSRSPIPGVKGKDRPAYYKQVGIYAFNYQELKAFGTCREKASYERYEDIEILRFFDLNKKVKIIQIEETTFSIDVPEDRIIVEGFLRKKLE